jgi:hypothetical protein
VYVTVALQWTRRLSLFTAVMSSGISRITTERNQRTLLELAMQPGNGNTTSRHYPSNHDELTPIEDVCADCKSWHPRWASHNLGIFIWCVLHEILLRTCRHSSDTASIARASIASLVLTSRKCTSDMHIGFNPDLLTGTL